MKVKVQYIRGGKVKSMHPRFAKPLENMGIVRPYLEPQVEKVSSKKVSKKKVTNKKETRDLKPDGAGKYQTRDLKAED